MEIKVTLKKLKDSSKNKLPGLNQPYSNINIINLQIYDDGIRDTIEGIIRNTLNKICPAHMRLFKINWVNNW